MVSSTYTYKTQQRMLLQSSMLFALVLMWLRVASSSNSIIIDEGGPSNVTKYEGSNITLKCRTSKKDVTVTWLKSNMTLNLTSLFYNRRYSIGDDNSLVIQNITRYTDAGFYECVVRNGSNEERSQPVWLLIRFLEITTYKDWINRTLYSGEKYARFILSWSAFPKPIFSWAAPSLQLLLSNFIFENKSTFKPSLMYYTGNISLTIPNANTSTYSGYYTVSATTGYQTDTTVLGILNVVAECRSSVTWSCRNTKKCLYSHQVCDNRNDCGDWSDESNCTLPVPPDIMSASHNKLYKGVKLQWRLGRNNIPVGHRLYNITTQIEISAKEKNTGKQVVVKLLAFDGDMDGLKRFETISGLENDTTYRVRMWSETYSGRSINYTSRNVTIPRMVAPTAPVDVSVFVIKRYSSIWLSINYTRPKDDGGTSFIYGYLTKCLVDIIDQTSDNNNNSDNNKLYNCTSYFIELGDNRKGDFSFYALKGNTKYWFSIYFRSKVKQNGPAVSFFYTTPPIALYTRLTGELSNAAIAGITISCVSAFIVIVIGLYKALQRTVPGTSLYVNYHRPVQAMKHRHNTQSHNKVVNASTKTRSVTEA